MCVCARLSSSSSIYSLVYPFRFLHLFPPTRIPLLFLLFFSHFQYFQFHIFSTFHVSNFPDISQGHIFHTSSFPDILELHIFHISHTFNFPNIFQSSNFLDIFPFSFLSFHTFNFFNSHFPCHSLFLSLTYK